MDFFLDAVLDLRPVGAFNAAVGVDDGADDVAGLLDDVLILTHVDEAAGDNVRPGDQGVLCAVVGHGDDDQAFLGEMLAVAQDDVAHIADAQAVHQQFAEGNGFAQGDAVLAEIAKGSFVLHRIIAIDGDDVTLRGDGNLNNEYCKIIDIRAKAIGFYRKGRNKLDSTDGCKWRIYSWWWTRLYSIRRYLLFAMHPHIPRRWRRQTS